ncbi:WecB/TagA/CpsF family glycosyltransferase [Dellaglioa algida]|uniref:N-acetylglucosaminyldiphosphoundecaprenol N-acetyl-beta-D-mannosaminyltransferase n=1 Tax=Dellaglioa algida TaxID=105612 RepID=A0A5C6MAC5_9LACO|nr:WecB/TagA/CpsF family glycosyltransferase [Dellaglioa algida]MDK1717227.1 WecB/TagA/CpsF family glycosyltransferase [Dellaglioa algida]MDK1720422.1 WecB/TagA/CpsF family glycosyltransferase [Dellaglioa algida]MDK1722169.1 WecB/TagA/CpsF family glycosyltransferase [Dellaglioa algida]MDK1723713.1 WecB/TagA/CpsF family glycosyltransferase [Dellaglioa algida]MDK1725294.1 WecB/TagA/CpsF family glycosyltransferase [Dellaglioa algida]
MSNNFKKTTILDVEFINTTNAKFLAQIESDSLARKNRFIVTANPEIVLFARQHLDYKKILSQADYVTPDGIGIIKGGAILGTPLPERITGFDTLTSLLEWANGHHKSIYLVGAAEPVIQKVVTKMDTDYPNINLVGFHNGYFKNDHEIVTKIKTTQPDFIFVATGFPNQETFIQRNRHVSDSIWMGVGGSFDVLAGNVNRAPQFWQNHHVEWLYRLFQEPTRFIRMLAIPHYLFLIYKEKFSRRKKKN